MTDIKSILDRLTKAVAGTDKELFTEEERRRFAASYLDKWDENTGEDVIAEAFTDFWWDTDRECRRCSECGRLMREGYYCSEECLHVHYTEEQWKQEMEDNDQSYYTEW